MRSSLGGAFGVLTEKVMSYGAKRCLLQPERSGYAARRLSVAQGGGNAPAELVGTGGRQAIAVPAEFFLPADPVEHVLARAAVAAMQAVGNSAVERGIVVQEIRFAPDQVVESDGFFDVHRNQLVECGKEAFLAAGPQVVGDVLALQVEEPDRICDLCRVRQFGCMPVGAVRFKVHGSPEDCSVAGVHTAGY